MTFLLLMISCTNEVILSGKPEDPPEDKGQVEIFTRADSYQLPSTKGVNDESKVSMTTQRIKIDITQLGGIPAN